MNDLESELVCHGSSEALQAVSTSNVDNFRKVADRCRRNRIVIGICFIMTQQTIF
jgi:hypothetical protein